MRRHEASEFVRQYQQGFGRPIITAEVNGVRAVFVGKRMVWSRDWRWFTDFLLDNVRNVLGRQWGTDAQQRGMDHPVFRWFRRMSQIRSTDGSGTVRHEPIGFVSSLLRLGYALYLIEHHDQLDQSLVARLRRPQDFQAAYYETMLAAAFALSGATLQMAERRGQSVRSPEFWAVYSSGRRYAVEAKCKAGWRAPLDPGSGQFKAELRQWIRDQIYRASLKRLQNAVYCFELSIPGSFEEKTWRQIQVIVRETLLEAESMTVAHKPTGAAYVIVTNHAHLVDDDAARRDQVAMLHGYKLETFRSGVEVPLETALEWHDEHRDIIWLLSSMEEVERIPSTFDGVPPEFALATGEERLPLNIGQRLHITFPDSTELTGVLRDVIANGDQAHVVIEKAAGEQVIAQIPLTDAEAAAARRYGNAVFGKAEKRQKPAKDIFDLYDWFREVYSTYDRESLLTQVQGHAQIDQIRRLPVPEMAVRVAREVTKAAFHLERSSAAKQEPSERRCDEPRS